MVNLYRYPSKQMHEKLPIVFSHFSFVILQLCLDLYGSHSLIAKRVKICIISYVVDYINLPSMTVQLSMSSPLHASTRETVFVQSTYI